jgi:hypothetical protein
MRTWTALDNLVGGATRLRGTAEVDEAFLDEITGWREELAKNLALRNPSLSLDDLNFAVNRTIDRIIFLRIAEERGITTLRPLRDLLQGSDLYHRLVEVYVHADEKFNSGLFHFRKEAGRPLPDELTLTLKLDDRVLKEIVRNLYYPDSPYAFAYIPADILGQVYEQFLGQTIRLTAGHQAKVDVRPEVNKAGGIFYTPTYIVRFIVESTVGRLLAGQTPRKLERLRILDPACGSGTFLLGAYELLLDWHQDWYCNPDNGGPEKWASGRTPRIRSNGPKSWRLTLSERKRILTSAIFGVDLDANAVEVAKLNLLLKVLDGEDERQLSLVPERVLPDLSQNIRCGNSLVGPDILASDNGEASEPSAACAFDWHDRICGFGDIMDLGGFDAVIGNPPYLNLKRGFLAESQKRYLERTYRVATGQYDAFALFGERAIQLLRPGGFHGFIVPRPVLASESYQPLRELYFGEGVALVAECGMPFEKAEVEAVVLVVQKGQAPNSVRLMSVEANAQSVLGEVPYEAFGKLPNRNFSTRLGPETLEIIDALSASPRRLRDAAEIFTRGLECGKKDAAIVPMSTKPGVHPLVRGEDVTPYRIADPGLGFDANASSSKVTKDPAVYEATPKILVRRVTNTVIAALDDQRRWPLNTLYCITPKAGLPVLPLLGILNSSLVSLWFLVVFLSDDKLFPYLRISQLEQIPLPDIAAMPAATTESLARLVARMTDLRRDHSSDRNPQARGQLEEEAGLVARRIDIMVAELYGLSSRATEFVVRSRERGLASSSPTP